MKAFFCEMSMILLIQQNQSLREEFAGFGYDSSDKSLEFMKTLVNNHFLNYKVKAVLNNMFKEHVENKDGHLATMYMGFNPHYRKHEPVDGKRFYVWNIEETNGEYQYTHKGTATLDENENPTEWLEDYTSTFYGGGDDEDEDEDEDSKDTKEHYDENSRGYWFNGEIICSPGNITEISQDEYEVLKRYI